MRQGPLAALDAIKQATGEEKVHAIGYCVGGTLLAVTLAAMAAWRDERIASATLFAAQVDFTYAGDLKVFVDEEQVAALEQSMAERGYLEAESMATVFNMLRSNDLLWPYVINNYLKGKAPFPFDLLYWNSDATRLPAANHSFYLRNCYLDNKLAKGKMIDRQHADRSQSDQDADLQSGDAGGPHRAGEIGDARLEIFRRQGEIRASPAPATSPAWSTRRTRRNISIGPARSRATPTSTAGSPRPRSIPARGGRTGSSGSRGKARPKCPARVPGDGALKADRGRAGKLREGPGLKQRRRYSASV